MLEQNKIYLGDCLEIMQSIDDKSVDMILCDLPYGTTACKWDSIIPFEPLWKEYKRILKPQRSIILFGIEPFSSMLRTSNLEMYKYDWYWNKNSAGGYVNAKQRPMTTIETISIFSNGTMCSTGKRNMLYNPQGLIPFNKITHRGNKQGKENTYWRPSTAANSNFQKFTNYPRNYLKFSKVSSKESLHPTQKPIELCEYLIKTYSNEGDLILDNCCGSGTTCVAARNLGRNFIGIELDENYFKIANERITK